MHCGDTAETTNQTVTYSICQLLKHKALTGSVATSRYTLLAGFAAMHWQVNSDSYFVVAMVTLCSSKALNKADNNHIPPHGKHTGFPLQRTSS